MQEEVAGVAPVGLFSLASHQPLEWGCFGEVAMDQIYLTLTVSGLTLLVSAYVLGVALV